jgi:hypothetical protein
MLNELEVTNLTLTNRNFKSYYSYKANCSKGFNYLNSSQIGNMFALNGLSAPIIVGQLSIDSSSRESKYSYHIFYCGANLTFLYNRIIINKKFPFQVEYYYDFDPHPAIITKKYSIINDNISATLNLNYNTTIQNQIKLAKSSNFDCFFYYYFGYNRIINF